MIHRHYSCTLKQILPTNRLRQSLSQQQPLSRLSYRISSTSQKSVFFNIHCSFVNTGSKANCDKLRANHYITFTSTTGDTVCFHKFQHQAFRHINNHRSTKADQFRFTVFVLRTNFHRFWLLLVRRARSPFPWLIPYEVIDGYALSTIALSSRLNAYIIADERTNSKSFILDIHQIRHTAA